MRVHVLRHVSFEDEAHIGVWAEKRGHDLSVTRLYAGETPPDPARVDLLAVMGGPMSVHDEDRHRWLAMEKDYLAACRETGMRMIGVCLGAQLLALVLGGSVARGRYREIGWMKVNKVPGAEASPLSEAFPDSFTALHWHGDMFTPPPGAVRLFESEACPEQGFSVGDRVLGLQFHLESTRDSVESLLLNCAEECEKGRYVQSVETLRTAHGHVPEANRLMEAVLDRLAQES